MRETGRYVRRRKRESTPDPFALPFALPANDGFIPHQDGWLCEEVLLDFQSSNRPLCFPLESNPFRFLVPGTSGHEPSFNTALMYFLSPTSNDDLPAIEFS